MKYDLEQIVIGVILVVCVILSFGMIFIPVYKTILR